MIVTTLKESARYHVLGEGVQQALEWLNENDIRTMEDGRYEVDGDKLFVLVQRYTTRLIDDTWFEGHLKYIDLHYVAEGVEYFCYTPLARAGAPVTEYDNVEDDYLYHKDYETGVLMKEGDIVIVYPEDVHMPQRRALFPSDVVKACIKIAL
jgi:YhcH/YjgK/YiaL family protein